MRHLHTGIGHTVAHLITLSEPSEAKNPMIEYLMSNVTVPMTGSNWSTINFATDPLSITVVGSWNSYFKILINFDEPAIVAAGAVENMTEGMGWYSELNKIGMAICVKLPPENVNV